VEAHTATPFVGSYWRLSASDKNKKFGAGFLLSCKYQGGRNKDQRQKS